MLSVTRPVVEMFHELRGTLSESQRSGAEASARPHRGRPPWPTRSRSFTHRGGFAAWGAVYAMTVMAIVAALATGAVEVVAMRLVPSFDAREHWGWLFWIGLVQPQSSPIPASYVRS